MRSSLLALGFVAPLALGAGLGLLIPKWTATELEIAPGGRTFQVDGAAHRMPGTVTVASRDQRLVVANRDTVDRLVGVVLVPAGWRLTVPAEYCTTTYTGPRTVLIIR